MARNDALPRQTSRLHFGRTLDGSSARYAAYCAFVVIAFLCGGGSRGDIVSLAILRPVAVMAIGFALIASVSPTAPRRGLPFKLLLALFALVALQLVPLPYDLWSALPGRDQIAATDAAVGTGELWRALTISPNRTTNTLFALVIPLAAFMLISLQRPVPRRLLWPILAMAALSGLVGLLQGLGPAGGGLYFYAVTNTDSAVGLFSNRNHHAIFLASLLPLLAYIALAVDRRDTKRALAIVAGGGGIVFLVPLILTTGSRSGALLMVASLVITTILWAAHQLTATQATRTGAKGGQRATIIGIVAAIVVGSAAVLFVAARSPAFERLFAEQMDGEYRVKVLPYLSEMIWEYFPFGAGFGTFELAFKSIEPLSLLKPQYLNQAHNDGMQILIEGGLPAGIILAIFLGWFVVCGWRHMSKLVRSARSESRQPTVEAGPFAWTSMAILLAGSVADYPLRVPSIMLYAVLLCVLINVPPTAKRKLPGARASNTG